MGKLTRTVRLASVAYGVVLAGVAAAADRKASPPGREAVAPPFPFYAFCVEVGVPGMKPRPLADQASLLQDLGFDGIGYRLCYGEELDETLRILDRARLKSYLLHTAINLKDAEHPYDPQVPAAIDKLKGRPATISVLLTGLPAGDPRGMERAVKILRELGDLAAKSDLRISIYNHVNNWTESLPFTFEVVRNVDHPRVGANFNLCHWLKVDGEKDYRPLLRKNGAKIFAVTLCGAQIGSETWTNGLIQPLDRGNFDNRELLSVLRDAGYRGAVGLMCYGIPDNTREHLTRSMQTWKSLIQ